MADSAVVADTDATGASNFGERAEILRNFVGESGLTRRRASSSTCTTRRAAK